jgi:hypothetical protein
VSTQQGSTAPGADAAQLAGRSAQWQFEVAWGIGLIWVSANENGYFLCFFFPPASVLHQNTKTFGLSRPDPHRNERSDFLRAARHTKNASDKGRALVRVSRSRGRSTGLEVLLLLEPNSCLLSVSGFRRTGTLRLMTGTLWGVASGFA